MALVVRGASASDAEAIMRVLIEQDVCKPEYLESKVLHSINRSPETCFVALDKCECVGTILSIFNGFHIFLSHMAVDATRQRTGAGRRLHDALVERAKELGASGIITDSWLTATGFYYNLGYRLPGAVFLIRDVK